MNEVGLRRTSIVYEGHIADIDHRSIDVFYRQIIEFLDLLRRIVEIDGVFVFANLLGSGRGNQVLDGNRIHDVLCRQAIGMKRVLIEVDLNLPDQTAIRKRDAAPGTVVNCGLTKLTARSFNSVCEAVGLDKASCRTGTLDALKTTSCGGVTPAGSCFKIVWEIEVTCACAALMLTWG